MFGEGIKTRIKEKLLTECNLHTIVRLPNGVFNPYTGIRTNILFFTKGKPTEHVWYYEQPYPDGVSSYNKTKPMRFEEFADTIAWWGSEADGFKTRVQNQQAWQVDAQTIIDNNYNLDVKNPHIGESTSHDPAVLLQQYHDEQQQIGTLRDQLKNILAAALSK
jgi:type I restriction enzyme M protein